MLPVSTAAVSANALSTPAPVGVRQLTCTLVRVASRTVSKRLQEVPALPPVATIWTLRTAVRPVSSTQYAPATILVTVLAGPALLIWWAIVGRYGVLRVGDGCSLHR